MGTFPPSVAPPVAGGDIGSGQATPSSGAGADAIKLAMLAQLIQGLATQFPQGQQAIQTMMDGLRQLQSIVATQSTPAPAAAPPI